MSDTRLALHTNDLIACLTTRAGEIAGMIVLHTVLHTQVICTHLQNG
jgi:hypothetical protein